MALNILYAIFISLITFIVLHVIKVNAHSKSMKVESPIAFSQTARVAIDNQEELVLDKEENLRLNEFTAYSSRHSTYKILLGPVFTNGSLRELCEAPEFLQAENIVTSPIHSKPKFTKKPYEGCLFNIDEKRSVMIIKHPKPFVDQQQRHVNYVGIVADTSRLPKMMQHISFSLKAKDYYVNLLQISNTFSPFSQNLDWNTMRSEGLNYIGDSTELCKGTYAAAQYLVPKLKAIDHHTSITLNGLGTEHCPMPHVLMDPGIQKWLAVPKNIRGKIVQYSQSFHGKSYDRISYIYIPAIEAYSPSKINEFVKKGREALRKANIENSCGIIVDLRYNTGGDVRSMLLVLGGILPKGKVFGLAPKTFVILSNDGNSLFAADQSYAQYSGEKPIMARERPVAVLINWITASSAEITALSLKNNLKQAKLFGTKTSGALSTNQTFFLSDGNALNLMFERIYNREGLTAPLSLSPDQHVLDDLSNAFTNKDPTINAAINWLESLPKCK